MCPGVSSTRTSKPPNAMVSPSAHATVDPRYAVGLRQGPDDGAAGCFLQAQVAAGVILVMVGDEEVGEPPALGGEVLQDFFASGASIEAVTSGLSIVQQHAEVVGEARKLLDLELRHALAL